LGIGSIRESIVTKKTDDNSISIHQTREMSKARPTSRQKWRPFYSGQRGQPKSPKQTR
jgi:hypothetical protein